MVNLERSRAAVLASLAAMAVGLLLFAVYVRQFQREARGGDPVELIALRRDLPAGLSITEQSLIVRTLPERYVENRQVLASDLPRVLGVRAAIDLEANQTLLWTDLATTSEHRGSLSNRIPKGMRAMTIARVGRRAFGELTQPGDRVDVLLTRSKPGTNGKLVTVPLLQNLLVLAVGSSFAEQEHGGRSVGADSVTLLVSIDQASLLAQAKSGGILSLVLRNADDLEINEGLAETDDTNVLEQEKRASHQRRLRIEKVD